jgi:RNA polymerase sigma-70 factor (ECF subfamily)
LLSSDVALHSDGGGKRAAAPNVIKGADKVARGALGGAQKFLPKNLEVRLAQINGDPGLVSYLNGVPYSVLTVEAREDRICAIYLVSNLEKLARVPPLQADAI